MASPSSKQKSSKKAVSSKDDYGGDSLSVLRFPNNIRTRPGMYVGGVTADTGLFRIFKEVVDNSIDEAMNGHGNSILVEYNTKAKHFLVADRGRGIPTGMNKAEKKSGLELALTDMHGSGKFDSENYVTSAGLNGIGLKALAALSAQAHAYSANEGVWKALHLKRGILQGGIAKEAPKHAWAKKPRGTLVEWIPDPKIFGDEEIDTARMKREINFFAMLNPGLELTVVIDGEKTVYKSENGLLDMIYGTEEQKQVTLGKPFHFQQKGLIDIAVSWHDVEAPMTQAFVNSSYTAEEGTHVNGARAAIVDALRAEMDTGKKPSKPAPKARGKKVEKEAPIDGKFLLMGMQLALNWRMADPMYSGQTKDKLTNSEVTSKIKNIVLPEFSAWLKKNPRIITILIERAKKFQKLADKFQKDLQAVRTIKLANPTARGLIPGKLAQATGKYKPEEIELFLVEGDSAAGPAKEVRLPWQEILALKGKILNASRADLAATMNSQEVLDIITSVGAKPGEECRTSGGSVRVGHVIIMTDADADGKHIRALLVSLFSKYFRPWMEELKISYVKLPLFAGVIGEHKEFGFTVEEMLKKFPEGKRKNVLVSRLKGLGEMTNSELFYYGLDPKTRKLYTITLNDADVLEIERVMGDDVEYRKEFLGIERKTA